MFTLAPFFPLFFPITCPPWFHLGDYPLTWARWSRDCPPQSNCSGCRTVTRELVTLAYFSVCLRRSLVTQASSSEASACVGYRPTPPTDWRSHSEPARYRKPALRADLGSRHAWREVTEVEPDCEPETIRKSRTILHSISPAHDRLSSLLDRFRKTGESVVVVRRSLESWRRQPTFQRVDHESLG